MLSSTDLSLARRIEAGHAESGKLFACEAEPIAGGWAIFAGIDSQVTQAIGVGMNGPVSAPELDRLEAFFHSRGTPAIIDLCTLADASVLESIPQRGYTVREFTNVLARRLDSPAEHTLGIEVEETVDADAWGRVMLAGFMEGAPITDEQLAMVARGDVRKYFTLLDGQPSGAAGMNVGNGLATLFGDATIPSARARGLQLASIRHRLNEAARLGCNLASAAVFPGGISHRNYERAGFQLVYTRVMVGLTAATS